MAGNRLKKFHVREDLDIAEHQNDIEDLNSTARLTQAESLHLLVQLDVEHLEHQAYLCAPHERKLAMKLGLVVKGLSIDIIRRRILKVFRKRHRLFDIKVSP